MTLRKGLCSFKNEIEKNYEAFVFWDCDISDDMGIYGTELYEIQNKR